MNSELAPCRPRAELFPAAGGRRVARISTPAKPILPNAKCDAPRSAAYTLHYTWKREPSTAELPPQVHGAGPRQSAKHAPRGRSLSLKCAQVCSQAPLTNLSGPLPQVALLHDVRRVAYLFLVLAHGARTAAEARGYFVSRMRRFVGVFTAREMARHTHRLHRIPLVGVPVLPWKSCFGCYGAGGSPL